MINKKDLNLNKIVFGENIIYTKKWSYTDPTNSFIKVRSTRRM